MGVVVAGCGRVGRQVALLLSQGGEDVSVVDHRSEAANELGKSFDGTFHTGLVYDVDVLIEAGVRDADSFLAVTNNDNANLIVAQVMFERLREPGFAFHVSFPSGDIQILEMKVGEGGAGISVRALEREGGVRVAALRRGAKVMIADGDLIVEAGDGVGAAVRQGPAGGSR